MTSTGSGKRPRVATSLPSSTMHTKRRRRGGDDLLAGERAAAALDELARGGWPRRPRRYRVEVSDIVEIQDRDAGALRRRALLAPSLRPRARSGRDCAASASMNRFTVEPVPTPMRGAVRHQLQRGLCGAALLCPLLDRHCRSPMTLRRDPRNDCARFSGGHSRLRSGTRHRFRAAELRLLLLRSFLLGLLFRLSHVGSPVSGLVRGRSIYTRIEITSEHA